jgi:hypothetical protein
MVSLAHHARKVAVPCRKDAIDAIGRQAHVPSTRLLKSSSNLVRRRPIFTEYRNTGMDHSGMALEWIITVGEFSGRDLQLQDKLLIHGAKWPSITLVWRLLLVLMFCLRPCFVLHAHFRDLHRSYIR